jgi:hypothetical protein
MRRLLLLLTLCLGLTGLAPVQAAPIGHVAHNDAVKTVGHCHDDASCVHSACLGCALEPDLPRLNARPPIAAARPMFFPVLMMRWSRAFALDPPPPRHG